jgi:peptide/nickel transport system substrate-binding protein
MVAVPPLKEHNVKRYIVIVLAGAAVLVAGAPASAEPHERIGERINLLLGTPTTFPADQPFHIVHGWLLTSENSHYDANGKFSFALEVDGEPVEPDFVERTSEDGRLSRFWVFNFPGGLPAGTQSFTGRWIGPCQELVDFGYDVGGACENPTELRVANGALTRWVEFTDPRAGGTAAVGLEQEPPCLNVLLARCRLASTLWTAGVALPGAFRVAPNLSYEPVLVDRVEVSRDPFALTYHVKPEAVWSDGVPVGADDLIFTLRTILASAVQTRAGYELIVDAVRVDAKTARFVFTRPFPAWRTLFQNVLPAHVLAGRDFNSVWESSIADPATQEPIGSGPFLVTGWDQGVSLTLARNPRWWGPHRPFLDSIVFRFIPDTNSLFQALTGGDVDLLAPQPQLHIADLLRLPNVVVESGPGLLMEHLDLNTDPASMPLLREVWFRQAVAYALDRAALLPLQYGTLGVSYGAHQSLINPSVHESYQPSFARYAYSIETVRQIMQAHGCATGSDGVWVCDGVRASLKFATTTGNALRALVQEAMQAQARAAGIELVPDNSSAGVLFGVRLPARDYELIMFAWQKGADPGHPVDLYGCDGGQNDLAYCSDAVTNLLASAETEVDPVTRSSLLNQADALLAEDVPSLPLFLRPAFLTYQTTLHGPRNNVEAGPTWNVEDWWTE